jgi:hypothetical protein
MKIVFLNGPPHSGKDTAAEMLLQNFPGVIRKFAAPLKQSAAGMLGETVEWIEANKDKPDPRLNGETVRSFLINISEKLIKPLYGKQFFGKCMVGELDKLVGNTEFVFITDSGFFDEAIPVVNAFGVSNCLLVQVRRPGKTFEKDSRSYWQMHDLRLVNLFNDGRIDQLGDKLFGVLSNVWGCHR